MGGGRGSCTCAEDGKGHRQAEEPTASKRAKPQKAEESCCFTAGFPASPVPRLPNLVPVPAPESAILLWQLLPQ